jgi:glycosyltransferase involved in cell wall biosynthesis
MAISFGMLSTYPPTQCGLATFSQALVTHLDGSGADVGIVRIVDSPQPAEPRVTHQLVIGDRGAARRAAHALNLHDVAIIQHEYGIFGGRDGADVLDVLAEVCVPVISVLHTVLTTPSPNQRRVLAGVVAASSVVVTMTQTARQRLLDGWDVDPGKVMVIAHGAEDNRAPELGHADVTRWEDEGGSRDAAPADIAPADPAPANPAARRPTILTWGLLGPGKGIEWAIQAMAGLADLDPRPMYEVVGETHPRVVEWAGEAYRDGLEAQVADLGLSDHVTFDGRYLDGPTLRSIVRAADIILLPYDSRDQVTSGVLTEAVVAGKPVVSTSFPHAVELLSSGAGLLVPQGDADAISQALRTLLTDPALTAQMAATSRSLAPSLLWPAVAEQYIAVGEDLVAEGARSVA